MAGRAKAKRKTGSALRRWLVGLAIVLPLLALGASYGAFRLYLALPVDAAATGTVQVSIPRGAGFRGAVARLEAAGVVTCPLFFGLHAWLEGRTTQIKAGTYAFDLARTPTQILLALVEGAPEPFLVLKLREGEDVWDLCERVAALGLGSADELGALARDRALARRLEVPVPEGLPAWASPLEGYLYPDTYHLRLDESPEDVFARLVRQHRSVFARLARENATRLGGLRRELGLSERDIVTMASLVEAEVRVRDEAPTVAGVFYNRLRRGMKLQTDPTLVYHPDYRGEVPRPRHRRDATRPYNTYAHAGLPPGPIGNPGAAALAAAMAPAVTDLLFFVARPDGSGRHDFSRTGAEHRAKVGRLREAPRHEKERTR